MQQASSGPPAHIVAAGLKWVTSNTSGSFVLADSVVGGYRYFNRDPYYVVRVLAPDGKYHPAKSGTTDDCRYTYNGVEVTTTPCGFLVVSDEDLITLEWVETNGTNIPNYAVQGERNKYYVCHQWVQEQYRTPLVPGELDAEQGLCIVVTGGSAYRYSNYLALCAIPNVGQYFDW